MKVHLVEKNPATKLISKEINFWASYAWNISDELANSMIGAELYLHYSQTKPSHFGGVIVGYERLPLSYPIREHANKIVLKFEADIKFKNVKTDNTCWKGDRKIVL